MVEHVTLRGCLISRIIVAPNACEIEALSSVAGGSLKAEFRMHRREHRVVYAGTLGPTNRVEYLAEIAAEASKLSSVMDILITGDGMRRVEVKNRTKELGVLGSNCFMVHPIPRTRVASCLRSASLAASLFVALKELRANSANKFFDAIAAGVPVLINYGGWQAELLASIGAGIRVAAREPSAAAKTIVEFLTAQGIALRRHVQQSIWLAENMIAMEYRK
jgi:glycosyltransferase involved in cell wall biosynthesis